MIKNIKDWEKFEKDLLRKTKPDYQNNLKIFQQLYEEAILLNAFPSGNPSVRLKNKIKILRVPGRFK